MDEIVDVWVGCEGYVIRMRREYNYAASFRVSRYAGFDTNGTIWFSTDEDDTTPDFDKAEPFLTGDVKWDGCSNWDFHTEDCMAHFCGRKSATSIGRLMDVIYDLAKEELGPLFDAELAQ